MEKWLQVKKRHHYVWEYYLKNWATDGKVYWITQSGNISWKSPKDMCREDGFYKINPLNKEDVEYLKEWSSKSDIFLQKQHYKDLKLFVLNTELIRICSSKSDEHKDLKQVEEILRYNPLENLYWGVENGARPAVEGLAKGEISVLENESNLIGLYSYIGHQITRTMGFKERFLELSANGTTHSKALDDATRLAEKNWWFLSYMLGGNIGWSLYSYRHKEKLIVVDNSSEHTFITGDSPVVNIHPDNDKVSVGLPTESLDIYFPISPRYAVIICSSSKWNYLFDGASMDDAKELNSRLAQNSRYSIYGLSNDVVKQHKSKIRQW